MATPLFRQGASPNAKLFLYAVACVCLMAIDSRVRSLEPIRQTISIVLYPVQQGMGFTRNIGEIISTWLETQTALTSTTERLQKEATLMALQAQQYQSVKAENEQLRQLLTLQLRPELSTTAAQILYETREPIVRKLILNKGSASQLTTGMPVIDQHGVVGQIVRVSPVASEVHLITDKDQATPVHVLRNGLRAVVYGGIQGGLLEIRFMAGNVDIKEGDELYTSGIDGVYPPDLPVAKVIKIDQASTLGFAKIICQPLAGVNYNRHVAIITHYTPVPPRSELGLIDDKNNPKNTKHKPSLTLTATGNTTNNTTNNTINPIPITTQTINNNALTP